MDTSNEQFEVEIVDLEADAKAGNRPRRARTYKLRIDSEYKTWNSPSISGREILALVNKTPERFILTQKVHGSGTSPVTADQVVDLMKPGVERFMTLGRDATDGEQARRQFLMRSADIDLLNATGLAWEAVRDGATNWVLIPEYQVPSGYRQQKVTLALQVPDGYPDQQIDIVYFSPALDRVSGEIASTSVQSIAGQAFQRWSRHRTAENPWRPGLDDIGTHLVLVGDWLEKELLR